MVERTARSWVVRTGPRSGRAATGGGEGGSSLFSSYFLTVLCFFYFVCSLMFAFVNSKDKWKKKQRRTKGKNKKGQFKAAVVVDGGGKALSLPNYHSLVLYFL